MRSNPTPHTGLRLTCIIASMLLVSSSFTFSESGSTANDLIPANPAFKLPPKPAAWSINIRPIAVDPEAELTGKIRRLQREEVTITSSLQRRLYIFSDSTQQETWVFRAEEPDGDDRFVSLTDDPTLPELGIVMRDLSRAGADLAADPAGFFTELNQFTADLPADPTRYLGDPAVIVGHRGTEPIEDHELSELLAQKWVSPRTPADLQDQTDNLLWLHPETGRPMAALINGNLRTYTFRSAPAQLTMPERFIAALDERDRRNLRARMMSRFMP